MVKIGYKKTTERKSRSVLVFVKLSQILAIAAIRDKIYISETYVYFLQPQIAEKFFELRTFDPAMGTGAHFAEPDIQDAHAFQIYDIITEGGAHSADLMLFSFGKRDAKGALAEDL